MKFGKVFISPHAEERLCERLLKQEPDNVKQIEIRKLFSSILGSSQLAALHSENHIDQDIELELNEDYKNDKKRQLGYYSKKEEKNNGVFLPLAPDLTNPTIKTLFFVNPKDIEILDSNQTLLPADMRG